MRKHKNIATYPNGNLSYIATGRTRSDGVSTPKISERKLLWDGDNRLRALSDDGYVSLYWYDADGDRTVKERHGGEAVWVNSEPGGMVSGAPRWTVTPDGFITFDGTESYTEHVYIGGERVASIRRPFSAEYYADNVQHLAGVGFGSGVDYSVLISKMRTSAAGACDSLGVPWSSYTSGGNTRSGEPTIRHIRMTPTSQYGDTTQPRTPQPDYSLDSVYYYHRDHLGGTMTVTDGVGAPVQQVEYTPWGEVFVELCNGNSGFTTPYLFNGKDLDEETGLYYYGARYYDPKMSVWYSTDPMEMDYPGVTTYGYCIDNPVKLYDANGEDWYQDTDGTIQYNPKVHSQKDLKGSQRYLYKERNYKEQGINYRKDGSILYKNETVAYNRMWSQANTHYRKNRNGGREVGGFILDNGYVLVLPDYLNDSRTTKTLEYGYRIENSKLTKGSESFSVLAQIHTHQDTSASPKPSYWMGEIRGDFDVSLSMGGKPVFTIGHDGGIYALIAIKKPLIADYQRLPSGYNTRNDLLNGKAKLYLLLINNK